MFFDSKPTIQRNKTLKTTTYIFSTNNPQCFEKPWYVLGAGTNGPLNELSVMPEECYSQETAKEVFNLWLQECKSQFVKPPTIEQCLSHYQPVIKDPLPMVTIDSQEEDLDWQVCWVPTHIEIEQPYFRIVWAPLKKVPLRIDLDQADGLTPNTKTIELQTQPDTWLHETEPDLPLSNKPALRLDADLSIESQREKYRKRVRDARLRAKLAKYRAQRMEQRYFEKFGVWPEEDLEEAQTEAENSSEDEA